jgi:hypothetical protein
MEMIEVGQVWECKDHRIIIFDAIDTPWGDKLATVRQLGDPQNTLYNLSEAEIHRMYRLVTNPIDYGSRCNSCGYINEYVQDLDYTCYKCRGGY